MNDVARQRQEENLGIELKTERDLTVNDPVTQCDVSYFYGHNGMNSVLQDIDPTTDWDWTTMTEDDKTEVANAMFEESRV